MSTSQWQATPTDFLCPFDAQSLQQQWEQLHAPDLMPWPGDMDWLEAEQQQELIAGWTSYHQGNFAKAWHAGQQLGPAGAALMAKAAAAYTDYVCDDEQQAIDVLKETFEQASEHAKAWDDDPNVLFAAALSGGRYSQKISIAKALAMGLGGQIKGLLDAALELAEEHAEAHTASGLYHAEIINKIGATIGRLTYGASAKQALAHFDRSMDLAGDVPITAIEYANGLLLLQGDKGVSHAQKLYAHAANCEALDSVQHFDRAWAAAQLEE